MDFWVVSIFSLLWIVLLWTFMCKYLCICFQFFAVIYLGVELLSHIVILHLTFWISTRLVSTAVLTRFSKVSINLVNFLNISLCSPNPEYESRFQHIHENFPYWKSVCFCRKNESKVTLMPRILMTIYVAFKWIMHQTTVHFSKWDKITELKIVKPLLYLCLRRKLTSDFSTFWKVDQ